MQRKLLLAGLCAAALVVQQAALHDGNIELSDGPLGGLRATLTVTTAGGPKTDEQAPRHPANRATAPPSPPKRRLRR